MCYMRERGQRPSPVGVRELRQNLSVYLDRVKAGESFEVTEHGRPVARLGPKLTEPTSILDQMIADGRATSATFDRRNLPAPPRYPGRPLSEIVIERRNEERS